jgi:Tfp pilus assembly protein FimV
VPIDAPLSLGLGASHLLVAVVAMVVVLFGALAIGNGALASLAPAPSAPSPAASSAGTATETVTVQPGDTLWTIAGRLQPSGDVRGLVDQLQALNGSAPLQAGEQVRIPA